MDCGKAQRIKYTPAQVPISRGVQSVLGCEKLTQAKKKSFRLGIRPKGIRAQCRERSTNSGCFRRIGISSNTGLAYSELHCSPTVGLFYKTRNGNSGSVKSQSQFTTRHGLTILGMIFIPTIIVIFLVLHFYPNACVPGIRQHTPLVEQ